MSLRKRTHGKTGKTTGKGREIVASLTELAEVLEAGRSDVHYFTARNVKAPHEPGLYDAETVRRTRARFGASQSVFAQLLGVSTILVQSWERGARVPAPWARRLLDELNRDPQHWRRMLGSSAA